MFTKQFWEGETWENVKGHLHDNALPIHGKSDDGDIGNNGLRNHEPPSLQF
jgi:hypothetical protein